MAADGARSRGYGHRDQNAAGLGDGGDHREGRAQLRRALDEIMSGGFRPEVDLALAQIIEDSPPDSLDETLITEVFYSLVETHGAMLFLQGGYAFLVDFIHFLNTLDDTTNTLSREKNVLLDLLRSEIDVGERLRVILQVFQRHAEHDDIVRILGGHIDQTVVDYMKQFPDGNAIELYHDTDGRDIVDIVRDVGVINREFNTKAARILRVTILAMSHGNGRPQRASNDVLRVVLAMLQLARAGPQDEIRLESALDGILTFRDHIHIVGDFDEHLMVSVVDEVMELLRSPQRRDEGNHKAGDMLRAVIDWLLGEPELCGAASAAFHRVDALVLCASDLQETAFGHIQEEYDLVGQLLAESILDLQNKKPSNAAMQAAEVALFPEFPRHAGAYARLAFITLRVLQSGAAQLNPECWTILHLLYVKRQAAIRAAIAWQILAWAENRSPTVRQEAMMVLASVRYRNGAGLGVPPSEESSPCLQHVLRACALQKVALEDEEGEVTRYEYNEFIRLAIQCLSLNVPAQPLETLTAALELATGAQTGLFHVVGLINDVREVSFNLRDVVVSVIDMLVGILALEWADAAAIRSVCLALEDRLPRAGSVYDIYGIFDVMRRAQAGLTQHMLSHTGGDVWRSVWTSSTACMGVAYRMLIENSRQGLDMVRMVQEACELAAWFTEHGFGNLSSVWGCICQAPATARECGAVELALTAAYEHSEVGVVLKALLDDHEPDAVCEILGLRRRDYRGRDRHDWDEEDYGDDGDYRRRADELANEVGRMRMPRDEVRRMRMPEARYE